MKFDAVIGNPPYQEESATQSETNGQAPRKNVFHYFQIAANQITSGVTSLIYPGARWIQRSGKGMEQFGLEQINDIHLQQIDFYPVSQDIFKDVDIADGISMVFTNKTKQTSGFKYVYHKDGEETSLFLDNPGEELLVMNPGDQEIVKKIVRFVETNKMQYLASRILVRSLFGIESNFVEENPSLVREYRNGDSIDFHREIKLFTNDKAGKAGRAKWFVTDRNNIPSGQEYIDEWQVVVSSANAGGQKRDNQIEIIDNHSAFGRARVALASFKTKEEAFNFFKYAKTYIIRFMFLMTDENLSSLGKKSPGFLVITQLKTNYWTSQRI